MNERGAVWEGESVRVDRALSQIGLARSRSHAAQLVEAGEITRNGHPVVKTSEKVRGGDRLRVTTNRNYVSRAAYKLLAAFEQFHLNAQNARALDLGASTGGFSQVLLEQGAASVVAVDVGHNQLDPSLLQHPKLTLLEGCNARHLNPARLALLLGRTSAPPPFDFIVADLSFISLRHMFQPILSLSHPNTQIVLLFKPQFEVGQSHLKHGIVQGEGTALSALKDFCFQAANHTLTVQQIIPSPIYGEHGNREFLLRFTAHLPPPKNCVEKITRLLEGIPKELDTKN